MESMSSSRRAAVIAAALLALIVTACTASGTATTGGGSGAGSAAQSGSASIIPNLSRMHWHTCGSLAGLQCTSVQVPVNYDQPNGRKLSLALSMAPATAPKSQQQGILLVNPGGPGASGLSLASEVQQGLNSTVASQYDIVGFDTRGVGSSEPQLTCDPSFFSGVRPDYIFSTAAQEQVLVNRAKTYANDCEKRYGWLLPYMTTANIARDLDSIRQAFGVSQLNYYAFSYGTYLGEVYGTMFPSRVRRMVLDSTVDPTGVWWNDNLQQDYAFQGRMNAFFTWVAKYNSIYHLGSTAQQVHNAWYQARNQLMKTPITSNGRPLIGPAEYDDTFLLGGYLNTLWPGLAQALADYLQHGSTTEMITQFNQNGVQNENEFAVYNAVQCADVNWPRSWSTWDSVNARVYKTAPFEAWDNAWYNAACAFWPVTGPAKPMQINGSGLPGILMLQGTLDAATPYQGAEDARKALPSARMVVVSGGGNHGQSLEFPPDSCVQTYLNNYLLNGALPGGSGAVSATCPVVPDPVPNQ
jgi:pimeloyl-ACP methyl ester carboxylesterase